jgi:hypothetical protein
MTKRYLKEGDETIRAKFALYDPDQVAQQVNDPRLRGHLNRGRWMANELPHLAQAGRDAIGGIKSLGNAVLSPARTVGPSVLRGLGSVGSHMVQNPRLLGRGLAVAAVAPILMNAFESSDHKYEDGLMSAYQNPERTITASLEDFLEKKAAFGMQPGGFAHQLTHDIGGKTRESFVEGLGGGLGKGVGHGISAGLFAVLGALASAAQKSLLVEPKRKALLETVIRNDPYINDAVTNTPNGEQIVMEAYKTMTTVAPTLSMDVNAVRSFLREAVIGGAGVNYATIKNLAETEKALAETHRAQRGGGGPR